MYFAQRQVLYNEEKMKMKMKMGGEEEEEEEEGQRAMPSGYDLRWMAHGNFGEGAAGLSELFHHAFPLPVSSR